MDFLTVSAKAKTVATMYRCQVELVCEVNGFWSYIPRATGGGYSPVSGYDQEEESRRFITEENAAYRDNYARANSGGWFYDDDE